MSDTEMGLFFNGGQFKGQKFNTILYRSLDPLRSSLRSLYFLAVSLRFTHASKIIRVVLNFMKAIAELNLA